MSLNRLRGDYLLRRGRGVERRPRQHRSHREDGFTIIELIIVITISPIIIGGLALGLYSVLTLQSGVANRLTDSADAQAVQASFRTDVQSAQRVTTGSPSSPQCGTDNQVLGLEWDLNASTGKYETVVSYDTVAVTGDSGTTYSLVRELCTQGSLTPVSTTTIASNVPSTLTPNITCTAGAQTCNPQSIWFNAQDVATVSFPVDEYSSNDQYTLVAAPATSASSSDSGGPISVTTTAGCNYAAPNSGTYASSLCLIDFSSLTGNNYLAATQGCLETSAPLQGGSTMYFCIGITGAPVAPYALPTWTDGFLGNSINGTPFYTDVPGNPAIYQSCEGDSADCTVNGVSVPNTWGGKTTVTFSGITVVGPNGLPDTGWEFVSADAESTDTGESITWSSSTPMSLIPNGQSVDTPSDPIGNACNTGAGVSPQSVLTGGTSTTITCTGYTNVDRNGNQVLKTGTVMVEAPAPSDMTVTMIGTGLEGVAFGLLF